MGKKGCKERCDEAALFRDENRVAKRGLRVVASTLALAAEGDNYGK
jgi:hypothetical protein